MMTALRIRCGIFLLLSLWGIPRFIFAFQSQAKDDSLYFYLKEATQLRQNKSLKRAVEVLQKTVSQYPHSIEAKMELATTLSWQQNFDESLQWYEKILQENAHHVAALNGKARVLSWKGKLPEAITLFQQILATHPQNTEAMIGLAFALRLNKAEKEAEKWYRKILEISPEHAEALEGLRNLYPRLRTDLTLTTGLLTVSEGRAVTQHGLEFSQQLKPRNLFLTGALYRSLDSTTPNQNRTQQGIHLGMMRQAKHDFTTGASLYYSFGEFDTRYTLALDATKQLSKPLTILATIRPGMTASKQFEWMAGGGVLYQLNQDSYLLSQYLATHFYDITPAHTLNTTVYLAILPILAIQPTMFIYKPQQTQSTTLRNYTLGVHFRFKQYVSLGAHYGMGKGQPERIGFSLRLRR